MSQLYHLVYVSSAVRAFSREELAALLAASRSRNERAGITGMLLYKEGNFMQVLEGEADVVQKVHARILGDPRHCGWITLIQGPLAARHFPGWTMGFRDLAGSDTPRPEGYSAFLNTSLTGAEFAADPSLAQKLLLSFKKRM